MMNKYMTTWFPKMVTSGTIIGTGLGLYESLTMKLPKPCDEAGKLMNTMSQLFIPAWFALMGGLGGALPPFGCWSLYIYYKHKQTNIKH